MAFGLAGSGCARAPKQSLDTVVDGGSQVRWLAGDSLIAVALLGRGVAIVSTADGEERAAWRLPTLPPHAAHGLAASAGGETLAVAADDSVHVVRARDGVQLMAAPGGGRVLALSDDGSQLAWSDGTLGRILSTHDGRMLAQGGMPAGRNGLVWSSDDRAFVWTSGRQLQFKQFGQGPGRAADSAQFGADGGAPMRSLGPFMDAPPTQLAFSGNGRTLAVAESSEYVSFWDTPRRRMLWRLRLTGRARVERMAFSADTWYLATAHEGRARIVWAYTGREVVDWSPHLGAAVRDLAFSHDGRKLATVGADSHLRVWIVPATRPEHR